MLHSCGFSFWVFIKETPFLTEELNQQLLSLLSSTYASETTSKHGESVSLWLRHQCRINSVDVVIRKHHSKGVRAGMPASLPGWAIPVARSYLCLSVITSHLAYLHPSRKLYLYISEPESTSVVCNQEPRLFLTKVLVVVCFLMFIYFLPSWELRHSFVCLFTHPPNISVPDEVLGALNVWCLKTWKCGFGL